ncbi:MAG TPA: PPOX class F420-dependent oxidoreductase [Terriglobales bacterium]|nr:PPOX class F420-dependent oxidoreductase [Terriglobales bacterium]
MPDSVTIPDQYKDLLTGKKAFASLATLMPDGTPQVTPVWFDWDGKNLMFNSARGRQKDKNVRRDPRVTLTIMDPENPYRYLEVRGRVTDITQEGATAHIDKMAKKYLDKDKYPFAQPGEVRVLYTVRAEKVQGMG